MTHDDIAAWRARIIRDRLLPGLDYLDRLRTRVEQTFSPDDPLSLQVHAAWATLTELALQLEEIENRR